jgi:hypothetical protein
MAQDRHKFDAAWVAATAAAQGVTLSTAEAPAQIAAALSATGAAAARAMTTQFEAEPSAYVLAQLAGRGRT